MPEREQPKPLETNAEAIQILERVRHEAEKTAIRIQENDKRMRSAVDEVEKGTKGFSWWMKYGVPVGLAAVFGLLYYSISPVVQTAVEGAAERIDWDKRIDEAAHASLEQRLTSEVLAEAVDRQAIQDAVSSVVKSKEFQDILADMASDAARERAASEVESVIAREVNFDAIVNEQVRRRNDKLQAVFADRVPITAPDRNVLSEHLVNEIAKASSLGMKDMRFDIYPFDDELHIEARLWWRVEEPEDKRFRIWTLTLEGMDVTADRNKESVAAYMNLSMVPAVIGVKRSPEGTEHAFVPGEYMNDPASEFAEFHQMSEAVVEDVIHLVEECFGMTYPATWRVRMSN